MGEPLTVIVHRGKNFIGDVAPTSPVVLIQYGEDLRKTLPCYDDHHPHWDTTFTFDHYGNMSVLNVMVQDWNNHCDNTFLGHVNIDLLDILRHGNVTKWYRLLARNNKGWQGHGALLLTLNIEKGNSSTEDSNSEISSVSSPSTLSDLEYKGGEQSKNQWKKTRQNALKRTTRVRKNVYSQAFATPQPAPFICTRDGVYIDGEGERLEPQPPARTALEDIWSSKPVFTASPPPFSFDGLVYKDGNDGVLVPQPPFRTWIGAIWHRPSEGIFRSKQTGPFTLDPPVPGLPDHKRSSRARARRTAMNALATFFFIVLCRPLPRCWGVATWEATTIQNVPWRHLVPGQRKCYLRDERGKGKLPQPRAPASPHPCKLYATHPELPGSAHG